MVTSHADAPPDRSTACANRQTQDPPATQIICAVPNGNRQIQTHTQPAILKLCPLGSRFSLTTGMAILPGRRDPAQETWLAGGDPENEVSFVTPSQLANEPTWTVRESLPYLHAQMLPVIRLQENSQEYLSPQQMGGALMELQPPALSQHTGVKYAECLTLRSICLSGASMSWRK